MPWGLKHFQESRQNHPVTFCRERFEDWAARKRQRVEGKLCARVELPHSSQKEGLNGPPGGSGENGFSHEFEDSARVGSIS